MPDAAAESRRIEGDVRLALLTGAVGWRDRNSSYTAAELAAVGVLATNAGAVVTVLLVSAGLPAEDAALAGSARWAAAGAAAVILAAGIAPTVAWPLGWRPRRAGPVRMLAVVRVAAAMGVVGCWTALLGPLAPAPAWAMGGVVGGESALTAWSLGVRPTGWELWWRFQRSSVHAGILLASVGVAATHPARTAQVLLVLLTVQVIALAAAVTCTALDRLRSVFERHTERRREALSTTLHRRMAHWLHDEVTSSLRLIRFRLQTGQISSEEAGAKLDELDHRLRLRQLDEVLASGGAQIAEVLQPYVRLAQDHGVDVTDVPRFDDAAITVRSDTGRLVQRALGVVVPNAIAAGTSTLAFRVTTGERAVAIEVEDDAGGFDLATVPAGRGLDSLRRDLGRGHVTCVPTAEGSRVRVVVDLPDGVA